MEQFHEREKQKQRNVRGGRVRTREGGFLIRKHFPHTKKKEYEDKKVGSGKRESKDPGKCFWSVRRITKIYTLSGYSIEMLCFNFQNTPGRSNIQG